MAWITPKTNWFGEVKNGIYKGDRFNIEDYNRINGNLEYLQNLATSISDYKKTSMGRNKTYQDFLYAHEMNAFTKVFKNINNATIQVKYPEFRTYYDNGGTMTYQDLNLLESSMLDMYEKLNSLLTGRRMFTWNFEQGGF